MKVVFASLIGWFMDRFLLQTLAGLALCAVLATGSTARAQVTDTEAGAEAAPDEVSLRVEGGLVSVALTEASLVDALTALARRSGFELIVEGGIDRRVSLSRSDIEIADLLAELLRGCSWFSLHDRGEAVGREKISLVWIMNSRGCGDQAAAEDAVASPAIRVPASPGVDDRSDPEEKRKHLIAVISGRETGVLPEILDGARNADDQSIRNLSLMALGRLEGPEAAEVLVEALTDDSLAARRIAFRSLSQFRGETAVPRLGEVLARGTETQVIRAAARQLGRIGTKPAMDVLREAARSDNPQVRIISRDMLEFIANNESRSLTPLRR